MDFLVEVLEFLSDGLDTVIFLNIEEGKSRLFALALIPLIKKLTRKTINSTQILLLEEILSLIKFDSLIGILWNKMEVVSLEFLQLLTLLILAIARGILVETD